MEVRCSQVVRMSIHGGKLMKAGSSWEKSNYPFILLKKLGKKIWGWPSTPILAKEWPVPPLWPARLLTSSWEGSVMKLSCWI
jgi:hypothetical protein